MMNCMPPKREMKPENGMTNWGQVFSIVVVSELIP